MKPLVDVEVTGEISVIKHVYSAANKLGVVINRHNPQMIKGDLPVVWLLNRLLDAYGSLGAMSRVKCVLNSEEHDSIITIAMSSILDKNNRYTDWYNEPPVSLTLEISVNKNEMILSCQEYMNGKRKSGGHMSIFIDKKGDE